MSVIVLRQKSVRLDLSPSEAETPYFKSLVLDKLKTMYEGTCMDRSYVIRIVRILGNPGLRVWNPRKMNGEMGTSVMFEYEAEILVPQSEVKTQSVLHGGRVVEITETAAGVLASCTFGDHMTGTIIIDLHGIVTPGMIIPVRVSDAEYPQTTMNNITIVGELLKPSHFNTRNFLVAPGSAEDIISGQKLLDGLNADIARIIASADRAQYFKAWLYPYAVVPERKSLTISNLLTKRETKAMYIMIDDACDIANLEFIQIDKRPMVDTMSFSMFVSTMIDEARAIWNDIEKFAMMYEDNTIFADHKTIWKYYESLKFSEFAEVPKPAPKVSKPAIEKSTPQTQEPATTNASALDTATPDEPKPVAKPKRTRAKKVPPA